MLKCHWLQTPHRMGLSPGRDKICHMGKSSCWPWVRRWFYPYMRTFRKFVRSGYRPPVKQVSVRLKTPIICPGFFTAKHFMLTVQDKHHISRRLFRFYATQYYILHTVRAWARALHSSYRCTFYRTKWPRDGWIKGSNFGRDMLKNNKDCLPCTVR